MKIIWLFIKRERYDLIPKYKSSAVKKRNIFPANSGGMTTDKHPMTIVLIALGGI